MLNLDLIPPKFHQDPTPEHEIKTNFIKQAKDVRIETKQQTILKWKNTEEGRGNTSSYERVIYNGLLEGYVSLGYISTDNQKLITAEHPFFEVLEHLYQIALKNPLSLTFMERLPKKTYNKSSYGLAFQIDSDGINWTCSYYSHFEKKINPMFDKTIGATMEEAAQKMYEQLKEKFPSLLEVITEPEQDL